jgi:hypothetical protein
MPVYLLISEEAVFWIYDESLRIATFVVRMPWDEMTDFSVTPRRLLVEVREERAAYSLGPIGAGPSTLPLRVEFAAKAQAQFNSRQARADDLPAPQV